MTINGLYLINTRTRAALVSVALLLAIAPGCSQAPDQAGSTLQVAPEAAQYVARFEHEAANHGRALSITNLIVEFGQLEILPSQGGPRGECTAAVGYTPVVTLSREAWDSSSDSEREELVFHELGHCVLGRAHEAGLSASGIPSSVMNPTEIDGAIYKQYRDYYLAGLFSQ